MTEKKLLLATTNQGKIKEIKKMLKGLGLRIESLADHPELGTVQETGRTFAENSRKKSLLYSLKYPGLVLAEDSGLEVEALYGKPGVFSARFSGPKSTDEKNIKKLLSLLAGLPPKKRRAQFVCVASLAKNGKIIRQFRGKVRGIILSLPKGKNGFGYDPIFYYPRFRRTFAQLTPSEKNSVSHRGKAFKKLRQFLETRSRR